MTSFLELEKWSERHHKFWMDFLRIALGVIILVKGFVFINNTFTLEKILSESFGINSALLVQFLAFMHLFLGFMIIIGLSTRIACALMTPILLTAVFYVNNHIGADVSELLLSVLTLMLLVFFFFEGSGKFSVYYFLANSKRSRETDESEKQHVGPSIATPLDKEGNMN